MKSKNGRHENCGGFKRWVTSLTREELLDAMAFTFRPDPTPRAPSNSAKVNSHEYELLLSMVQLQPPPPTPVHPRATGYKSRSQKGARLDYFFKEEEHLRWTKPRLFQWTEQNEYSAMSFGRGNHRSHGRRHNHSTSKRRFNVVARKKVAPWGDIYSLGCTREQRDADCELIKGTRLGRLRRDGMYHATACFGGREETGYKDKRKPTQNDGLTAQSILKILQIASRGHFFQQDPTTEVSYCAPWLQPTERWFSLGMYLASRFQMALWDSYFKVKSNQEQYTSLGRLIRQGGNWQCYTESMLRDAIVRAIRSGLRDVLKDETTSSQLNYLRDGMLWSILEDLQMQSLPDMNENAKGYWKSMACALTQVPLVKSHILYGGKFQILISEKLEEELVVQIEQEMLVEEQKPSNGTTTGGAQSNKKKRKKSKRKKTKKGNDSTTNIDSEPTPTNLVTLSLKDQGGDPASIHSDSMSVEARKASATYEFPESSVTALERNKNIVFVLGIIEDITEQVFSKVGLEPTPKFDAPVHDKIKAQTNNNSNKSTTSTLIRKAPNKSKAIEKTKPIEKPKTTEKPKDVVLSSLSHTTKSFFPSGLIQPSRSFDQDYMNQSYGSAFSLYTEQNDNPQSTPYNPFAVGSDFSLNSIDDIGGYVDNWKFANRFQSREYSILTNLFISQNEKTDNNEDDDDEEERLMAASTAASIASSTYKETAYTTETEELPVPAKVVTNQTPAHAEMSAIRESDDSTNSDKAEKNSYTNESDGNGERTSSDRSSLEFSMDAKVASFDDVEDNGDSKEVVSISELGNDSNDTESDCPSPTLRAPSTPPPTLSPILVSLADLKKVKEFHFKNRSHLSRAGSLPPHSPGDQDGLVSSWSREDLRIESFRDDHQIKNQQRDRVKLQKGLEMPTYKSVTVKSLPKPLTLLGEDSESLDQDMQFTLSVRKKEHENKESCAQSLTAIDSGQREHQDWYREEGDTNSMIKDETTTIISGISHRVESEELAAVQEERNNFRDMCLTLGAEVAKLKVMLATQQAAAAAPVDFQDSSFGYSKIYGHGSFDPHGMQPFFHGMNNEIRAGPKSDAGFHRYGDHESLFSEDEMYDPVSKAREARIDSVQYMASSQTIASQTVAGSDVSIDFNSIKVPVGQLSGSIPAFDSFHFSGLQSRLTKDILRFLEATNIKMKKLDGRRNLAVQRFSRLVKTVWPRAQVKLYGSYVSGLCLPSSDLDFVVCLPAVHKKDLALAPGVLEGRNAINETSQKLLARELKGESWIDPRSIKVIERTAVPVIKVSTKDTRARMIQLDISFDSPEHHGLEANQMVAQTLEELPLIRPLMLVLKQFLLHRGLLTAYTGGLSSYCLFLMLARYLQEQPPSSSDCGSLLMGFLDFYGNFFDPRAIGISVGSRRYFARANSNNAAAGYEPTGQPIWNRPRPPHNQHQNRVVINNLPPSSNSVVFRRHNSFSDTGSVDGSRHRHRFYAKPSTASTAGSNPRFVPINNNSSDTINTPSVETNYRSRGNINNFSTSYDRPSTFDPLFVEDPLSGTNNVGRNAFRINQVQRAFSDAHRALVASLDWDIQSAEGNGKYPLLKCLLGNQREDAFYGI